MAIGVPNAGTATTFAAGTTSAAVPFPATTHKGALLTLSFSTFAVGITPSTPANWTFDIHQGSTGNTTVGNVTLFHFFALGTEGGTNLTVTTASTAAEAQIVEWSGVDTVNPYDVTPVATSDNTTASSSVVIPAVTVATNGATLYSAATSNTAAQTGTFASWTQLSNGSGASCNMIGGYTQGLAPGASSTQTITLSGSGKNVLFVVALRPVGAPARDRITRSVMRSATF